DYDMISFKAIDEKNGLLYFMASPANATQQYLYKISLAGDKEAERVSPAGQTGTHTYKIAPGAMYSSHFFSNIAGEWVADLVSLPNHASIAVNGRSEAGNNNSPA